MEVLSRRTSWFPCGLMMEVFSPLTSWFSCGVVEDPSTETFGLIVSERRGRKTPQALKQCCILGRGSGPMDSAPRVINQGFFVRKLEHSSAPGSRGTSEQLCRWNDYSEFRRNLHVASLGLLARSYIRESLGGLPPALARVRLDRRTASVLERTGLLP